MDLAIFGAGCFWGVEAAFQRLPGVKNTTVGYMGGSIKNPTYEQVCTNKTGHAEVVQIEYDPTIISYEQLLDVFWQIHDPTQRDRQGLDIGRQYRSVIFYLTTNQKKTAEESKKRMQRSGQLNKQIATELCPASLFFIAEQYHQHYFQKQGIISCHTKKNGMR